MSGNAWVTLATNDSYALGTLVLASSLRAVGTAHQIAVMVTRGVSSDMKERLRASFDLLFEVNVLDSQDEVNLALMSRPELGLTFTKLHCWRLTQFQKCVFLDADTMVVQNCDELFDREELSAAPDVGWPDCFNSGVFVYRPSLDTFKALLTFAITHGSFDGGDQGLLNSFFSDWTTRDIAFHLPFAYNMCSNAVYSYLPAYKKYGDSVKIVHFIGPNKPWLMHFNVETGCVHPPAGFHHVLPLLQKWWDIFFATVHSTLSPAMAGLAGAFAQLKLGTPRSQAQKALEEHLRRQNWEQGQADYMGADSFENIWNKICNTLSAAPGKPSKVKHTDDSTTTSKTDDMIKDVQPKVPATEVQGMEASASQTAASISTPVILHEKQSSLKASDQVVEVAHPVTSTSSGTSISTVALPFPNASMPDTLHTLASTLPVPASPPISASPVTSPPLITASPPAPPPVTYHLPSASSPATALPLPASPPATALPPASPPATAHPPPASPPATALPPPASPPTTALPPPASPPATAVPPPASPPATALPPPASLPATALPPTALPTATALPTQASPPVPPQVSLAPAVHTAISLTSVDFTPDPTPISPTSTHAAAGVTASRTTAPVVSAYSASKPQTSKVASPSPNSNVDVTSGAKKAITASPGSEPAVPVPPKRRGPHKATIPKDVSKSTASQPAKTSKPSPKGKK